MEVREFRIAIPQDEVDDLHRRLENTRWPREIVGEDWRRGVPLNETRRLTEYWKSRYDWRREEAALNRWPQFVTEIDGQRIHFLHVRSRRPDATPLLIVHGYPGSFVDFLSILAPLSESFHVVVPSMPGFGFSTPLSAGWEVARSAAAFDRLMVGLGYQRYGVQGGDIGAGICGQLAATAADRVIAALINTEPAAIGTPYIPPTDHLNDQEKARLREFQAVFEDRRGYLTLQSTRPRTIAYDLCDSPVGQLTWIVEKFHEWTDQESGVLDEGRLLDQLLTNVSLYWYTQSGASAAEFLYEAAHSAGSWAGPPAVPVGMVSFGRDELVRRVLDPYQSLTYWSEHDHGGHFPAITVPELLVGDIRRFFGNLK